MNEINLAHLDLNLLVTFEVLMTEGSVTRAADHLSRTQSAISHQLKEIEDRERKLQEDAAKVTAAAEQAIQACQALVLAA